MNIEDANVLRNLSQIESKRAEVYIAETKGGEDMDDVRKIKRLQVWCNDVNSAQSERRYIPPYVSRKIGKSIKMI